MLTCITPLGERGRRMNWSVTVGAFLVGATAAGAVLGAVCGGVGTAVGSVLAAHARLGLIALVLVCALVLDLAPQPPPGPRRQVDERWLDAYRGWVYGVGYGAQLGLGITTLVSSAATYAAVAAAVLSASPGDGAVIMGCYGLIRGLTPLTAAGVCTPAALRTLQLRLDAWRLPVERLGSGALALLSAAGLILWV